MRIHKKLKHLFKGFTLVELIVVISVLAVLATIAMSQVSNITAWARDSQRMTDMSAMKSSIELYKAKTGKLPIPTNGSGVTYSWALLWTQGTFGEPTWRQLNSITPKPVDPTNAIEYVYSVANNNREFELGGILEKATGLRNNNFLLSLKSLKGVRGTNLSFDKFSPASPSFFSPSPLGEGAGGWGLKNSLFDQTFAASQNVTFIEGTYNGVSLKVETGSKTYVVAAPSLIGGYLGDAKMENTGLTIEGLGSLPKGFSGVVVSTAQTGTFTPVIAWSGITLPTTSTGAEAMIIGLQNAYTGSKATSLSQIASLVAATGSQVAALGAGLVENALGGDITGQSSGGGGYSFVCGVNTITDIEGNQYNTIFMTGANQCWMASNLYTTKYRNGSNITKWPAAYGNTQWLSDQGFYSCPANSGNTGENCGNASIMGMLYQWSAAMSGSTTEWAQGICPSGWHIPKDSEWKTLIESYATAGCEWVGATDTSWCSPVGVILAWSKPLWKSSTLTSNINFWTSGFNIVPAGFRANYGEYYNMWDLAMMLSSTPYSSNFMQRYFADLKVRRYIQNSACGTSVRCIKNN